MRPGWTSRRVRCSRHRISTCRSAGSRSTARSFATKRAKCWSCTARAAGRSTMADARSGGPSTSLPPKVLKAVASRLRATNAELARRYPGEVGTRQPVHTVYGGAHLFTADTAQKLGRVALRALEEYAPDSEQLAAAVGLADETPAAHVHGRIFDKLRAEPVEDFRIDFEDGYGVRSDTEEDGHAASVATEVARGMRERTLPPFIGIRIKPLTEELQARSLRTLDIFMTTLLARGGGLPANW